MQEFYKCIYKLEALTLKLEMVDMSFIKYWRYLMPHDLTSGGHLSYLQRGSSPDGTHGTRIGDWGSNKLKNDVGKLNGFLVKVEEKFDGLSNTIKSSNERR